MKKFKGGLYADLGNYKTTLPNTEILNNFFALNPVGYRSGGMVRGISGGNPTGMKVTGGFLANAQRYASGSEDAVSAYYSPSKVGVRPGNFRAAGKQYRSDLFDKIFELRESNPRNFGFASDDPKGHESIAKELGVSVLDVKRSLAENTPNSGIRIAPMDRVEQYDKEGKVKGDPVLSTLEQSEKQYPEGTKLPTYPPDIESKEKIEKKEKAETQSVGGMLPGGIHELAEYGKGYKQWQKDQKGFLDPDKIITKSDDSSSTNGKTEKPVLKAPERDSSGDSVFKGGSTYDKMTEEGLLNKPTDAKTMVDELFTNNEDYQKLINNYTEASESDKAALKKIGEEYYGKDKGKEAPAWAMPLMMMGLNMAASNNPDMLGAMAEGGIKGVEQYAKQQKEKKEEAKEKIELDLKKINKSIEISSRDLDFAKDITTIKSNIINQSMQIASNEMINYNNNLRTAIQADADRELKEWEIKEQSMINWANLDAKYDIANTEIDFKYMELMDKKEARKDDLTYKQDVLKVEIAKHNNDWQKHLNLVNLEKVSTGKTTTIMMPDNEGNSVQTKVHVYLNKETGEFETKVLGFAPPDADYLEDLTNNIREQITNSKTITIDGKEINIETMLEKGDMLAIEELVEKAVTQRLTDKFGSVDQAFE